MDKQRGRCHEEPRIRRNIIYWGASLVTGLFAEGCALWWTGRSGNSFITAGVTITLALLAGVIFGNRSASAFISTLGAGEANLLNQIEDDADTAHEESDDEGTGQISKPLG